MRSAFDDMLAKREARGELTGELKGKIQGILVMCQEFGVSMEVAIQKIMKECSLSEDKAQEYIQKYWVQN